MDVQPLQHNGDEQPDAQKDKEQPCARAPEPQRVMFAHCRTRVCSDRNNGIARRRPGAPQNSRPVLPAPILVQRGLHHLPRKVQQECEPADCGPRPSCSSGWLRSPSANHGASMVPGSGQRRRSAALLPTTSMSTDSAGRLRDDHGPPTHGDLQAPSSRIEDSELLLLQSPTISTILNLKGRLTDGSAAVHGAEVRWYAKVGGDPRPSR
jgi:hypothetical protein